MDSHPSVNAGALYAEQDAKIDGCPGGLEVTAVDTLVVAGNIQEGDTKGGPGCFCLFGCFCFFVCLRRGGGGIEMSLMGKIFLIE